MTAWIAAAAAGLVFAALHYWGTRGGASVPLALLRGVAVAILAALLLDAPAGSARPIPPWVALDASRSWMRGGDSTAWRAAQRAARDAGADSIFLFGDSVRSGRADGVPADDGSAVGPVVERALTGGRPLVVITDGEIDDPDALRLLTSGSRVRVIGRTARPDLAVESLELPRAFVSGDTVEARVAVVAGGTGSPAGTLTLLAGGRPVAATPVDSLAPYAERVVSVRGRIDAAEGPLLVSAVSATRGDSEARNDSVTVSVNVSRAASAVFVSTSPDYDSRYALAVLRGSLSLPTRGFFRVAPGMWRVEGSLEPATESAVREAFRDAPLAILHGDTTVFGSPRVLTQAPLALLVPSNAQDGEWYASGIPASPLAPALSGMPLDSLAPVVTSPVMPSHEWVALEARRGREQERRPVVVGSERPRRVVVVGGSGFWKWRFRGGAGADAYSAFWGSVFDWLSAQRADRRAAVPDDRVFRAGEPLRWRRGTPADSVVEVVLARRGSPAWGDTLVLRFGADVPLVESAPVPPGVYDVSARGGRSLLAVNPSREWIPRAPVVKEGSAGEAAASDNAPRLRAFGWVFALALLLLCGEWVLRRRKGLR